MTINLERVDSVPFADEDFSSSFGSWITNFVDTHNETLEDIENGLNAVNGQVMPNLTTVQIAALAPDAANGTQWYDSTLNDIVVKVNGVLVKLVTAAYP